MYGVFRLSVPVPRAPEVPVLVVQGNIDVGSQWNRDLHGQGLGHYLRLSDDGAAQAHPRLIIWPESAVTFFLEEEPVYLSTIGRVLRSHDAELILGGPRRDGHQERFFNSAFYVTADGHIAGRYDKVRLLPFAEYFPLQTIRFLRRHFGRIRYFTASDEPALLHTRFGDAATLICFEAIFPEVVRRQTTAGATFMLNLSNDAWFGDGAGADQHLMMVALRAVENRLWVVRGTTTGVSAIIDPYGRITRRLPLFTPGTIDGRIVPMNVSTPYKTWGDAFAWLCVLATTFGLLTRRGEPRPAPARAA
jgi:apolipoprotein N-acyltransferase